MTYVLVYKRNGKWDKQQEAKLSSEAEFVRFVYINQPMQIVAVRVETN